MKRPRLWYRLASRFSSWSGEHRSARRPSGRFVVERLGTGIWPTMGPEVLQEYSGFTPLSTMYANPEVK